MRNKDEFNTDEASLKPYPQETETVSIDISIETMEVLRKKAAERDLPLKALFKLYIGQGLRQDMSEDEMRDLALKRLASRKGAKKKTDIDLAA